MQLNKFYILLGGALVLASCGSLGPEEFDTNFPANDPLNRESLNNDVAEDVFNISTVSDTPIRIGAPFKVGKKTYTPSDVPAYDEVGYASWYGDDLNGSPTANGEPFNAQSFSGAHKTLPLPTYVEVTALDTGRTILVRINDRGPFANDRLIDLSKAAAEQLGILEQGVAGVRVRKVNPPEQERAVLRNGGKARSRIDTPDSLTRILRDRLSELPKPKAPVRKVSRPPVDTTASNDVPKSDSSSSARFIVEDEKQAKQSTKVASPSGFIVQLSSFASRSRADALARKVGGNVAASSDGKLFRVRFGPYMTEIEAQEGLVNARKRGYPQARIFRE